MFHYCARLKRGWTDEENPEDAEEGYEYSADTHELHHGLHGEEADGCHDDHQLPSCDYQDV